MQPKFDKVDSFYEQRSAVQIEDKWGFIDTHGNFIIEPHFEKASRFFEG
ncbi:WG repeat-containing protein [Chlorogloeopsis sp. ULAP01]